MESHAQALFEVASSLSQFALGTQCALAWIFAGLFVSFSGAARWPSFFRTWTWAWFARAIGLSAILASFLLRPVTADDPSAPIAELEPIWLLALYQAGKLLA